MKVEKRTMALFLSGKECLNGCGGRMQVTEHKNGDMWITVLECLKCRSRIDLDKVEIKYDAQKQTDQN